MTRRRRRIVRDRRPLPVDVLVSAPQDTVHRELGGARPAIAQRGVTPDSASHECTVPDAQRGVTPDSASHECTAPDDRDRDDRDRDVDGWRETWGVR
jgi:hypothetical protein